jgi:hypothetical protein
MPADVHLLLKSSDFVLHDLTQPFKVILLYIKQQLDTAN